MSGEERHYGFGVSEKKAVNKVGWKQEHPVQLEGVIGASK